MWIVQNLLIFYILVFFFPCICIFSSHTLVFFFPLTLPCVLTHRNNAEFWENVHWQPCFQELNGRTVGKWGSPSALFQSPTSPQNKSFKLIKEKQAHLPSDSGEKSLQCRKKKKNRKKAQETSKPAGKRGNEKAVRIFSLRDRTWWLLMSEALSEQQTVPLLPPPH